MTHSDFEYGPGHCLLCNRHYDDSHIPNGSLCKFYQDKRWGKESPDNNGGSSSYYDLPRHPITGEFPKTLQEVIKWWDSGNGMSWNQANIFKAAYRWDKKPDLEYNCNKIGWFNDDTLSDIYEQDPDNPRGVRNADQSD